MITHIFFDVDGTLTNGSVTYSSNDSENKTFSIKDGLILKSLPRLNILTIFITGRSSVVTEKRAEELEVTDVIQGINDKKIVLSEYFIKHNILSENTAYIGDDLNDYQAMKLCNFIACPNNAAAEIKNISDYVSEYNGGYGAVRDILEYLLKKENKYNDFLKLFIQ
jgi:3-deoxy-D-manno-octulosonate 8-phosphate phosphatase (KDO 8-P phosphatase)